MTVSYQYEVASSTSGGFTRLLFMWRGSLYKLIYRELLLFLALFGSISAVYRHVLSEEQKRSFEKIVVYCDTFINLIPLSFVLGFYVAYVAGRWWQQYTAIPWPDKVMHSVALYVTGKDEYARMIRRALMRYLNLSLILVLRSISSAVKRRFPTLDHVVDSGFMTALELELFVSVPSLEFNTYWIPCTWFINLLKEARENGRLSDAQGLKIIMEEFNDFRSKCGMLWSYDWVSIPLVYTQVVTLATYSFFAVALVGRQYIEGAIKPFQMKVDIFFPMFTVLQFFFFMGLLKVAEQLINPFGDDDEDFELNWLIDRHTKVSYLGVDTLMNRCPPLVKDIYYDSENLILPYTEAAAAYKRKTYRGSVANMTVPEEKQTMFLPNIMEEEEENVSATPRNSSASLEVHATSPPTGNRRSAARKSCLNKCHRLYKKYHSQSYGQYYRRYYERYYTQHYNGVVTMSHSRARKRSMKNILYNDTQGGSSPQPSSKLGRGSGETILTLDLHEDEAQQQQQQQQSSSDAKATNGRPHHGTIAGAVKMFATKGKFTEHLQSRRPFFALAKSSKVTVIQPWPSATNLKSDPIEGSDGDGSETPKMELKRLQQLRNFNIPSIDVRRSSIDDTLGDGEDEEDDDTVDAGKTAGRKRSQAMFEARTGTVNRGFLCREASIEETTEPHCSCDAAASSSSGCCNDSCPQRRHQLQRERSLTRLKKKRARAARFHSFPKFLTKRSSRRAGTPTSTTCSVTSIPGKDMFEESLTISKSSPELTLAVEFGASTSAGERVRARFYAGNEDDEDDDEELKKVVTKRC